MTVNIEYYELYQIQSEGVTADMLVWRRYRQPSPGVVEAMLDLNPQLSLVHRSTPFIPPGTFVRMPIDPSMLSGRKPPATADLWTDKAGYRL